MRKVLYVWGGPCHDSEWAGKELAGILAADGRYTLEMTDDLNVFATLPESEYAAVVVYTTGLDDQLTAPRENGLLGFVKSGRGFVGIHSAADSFKGSQAYIEMIDGQFLTHPDHIEFKVDIVDSDHYITTRMPDITIYDEMYHLTKHDPSKVRLLAQTMWQGEAKPMAYVRDYGEGRVGYVAPGHTCAAWRNTDLRKLMLRAIAWSAGAECSDKTINCGILGYGPAFNMGKNHAGWIDDTKGMKTVAVCDVDPKRVEAAKTELPGLQGYFTSIDSMLAMDGLDLIVNILPHNLHAPTTLEALNAGKHVVLEKPFCITIDEANAMIGKAHEKGLMLSLFHNRRWDGDYLTIKDIIARGLIGEVFCIEGSAESYSHPGFWWRSSKEISGGVMYDWGAHFIDWMLNLVPDAKVTQVTGDFRKRVWHAVTNEDHGQACIRFDNGVTAEYVVSNIAAIARPKWRILGTRGAIRMEWTGDIDLVSLSSGIRQDSTVKVTLPAYGCTEYYRNVVDHLLMGEELAVTPEQARRVIGVIDAAQRSFQSGRSAAPATGCE